MTTELVLLLCVFAFVTAGAIFGDKGPFGVLASSSPRLGARLEQNIATGRNFKVRDQNGDLNSTQWTPPSSAAPTGQL
jgi:hypothetical protein